MVVLVLLLEHVNVHRNGQALIVEFLYVIQPSLIVRMVGFVLLQIHAYVHLYGLVLIALSLSVTKGILNQMDIKHLNISNVI